MNRLALALALTCVSCAPKATEPEAPTADKPDGPYTEVEQSVAEAMNPEADACEDFYEYACGGWLANTELPSDKTRMSRSFTTIQDQNRAMLREILEQAADDPGDDPDLKKVGAFYGACMDIDAITQAGLSPVQPSLDAIAQAKDFKALWALVAAMHLDGSDPLFSMGVEPDYKDPTFNLLNIWQGGLGLPDRSFYLNQDSAEVKQAYQAHLAAMLEASGVAPELAGAQAERVVAFETGLAEVSWPRAELRDAEKTYNPTSVAELDKLTPALSWSVFLKELGYPEIENTNVNTPSFFEGLSPLLQETDLDTLKAYLQLRVLNSAAPYLSPELDSLHFSFYGTVLSGQQEQEDRWKRCVGRTESAMGEVLGKVYVERAFPGDSKAIALDMIRRVEGAFESGMAELDWMDDATRAVAIEKSQAITNKIGYPDKWRDYSPLVVEPGAHFRNVEAAKRFEARFWLDQAGKDVDRDLWYMSPQMVNAYYNPLANEIAFPAGILQPPFFSREFPQAMNYGAMGMVMGHEVSHGFDDSGRKFSPTGALTEWWPPEVAERFEERASCVEEQYNAYEVQPGLFVDGKLTLGENIADLGGMKQSFRAYRTWVEEHGAEPEIAGLTPEQLFFVAYAQSWCSIYTPEAEKVQVRSDPHSPSRFRVNGPLRNLPYFGEAFGCERGAPLFPEADEICVIW
ncbi:MAG: M13 family peptidase [Deltaproteobacteria bacterium]|nr:MAG: M13 family peptidase [Deltaproteobacteria bacterium]